MKLHFKPTNRLKGMVKCLIEVMCFKVPDDGGEKAMGIFMWIVLPIVPSTVLGWYLADLFMEEWD